MPPVPQRSASIWGRGGDEEGKLLGRKDHSNMSLQLFVNKIAPMDAKGSRISGRVVCVVKKRTKARRISILLQGNEGAKWQESRGSGKHRRTVTIRKNQEITRQEVTLCTPQGGKLEPGTLEFKFAFNLEARFPPSFRVSQGSKAAWVAYNLVANVDKPWWFDMKVGAALDVSAAPVDPNTVHDKLSSGVYRGTLPIYFCCCCFRIGDLNVALTHNRLCFSLEEKAISTVVGVNVSTTATKRSLNGIKFILRSVCSFWRKKIVTEIGRFRYSDLKLNPKESNTTLASNVILNFPLSAMAVPTFTGTMVRMEYFLVAVMDVPYAIDPEVPTPLIVVPRFTQPLQQVLGFYSEQKQQQQQQQQVTSGGGGMPVAVVAPSAPGYGYAEEAPPEFQDTVKSEGGMNPI